MGAGFSCLIKAGGRTVLFDTGAHGPTLLYNLEKLGFAAEEIDTIVLSHIDSDHVGGLFWLLESHWKVEVYVPESFPPAFKDLIALYGAQVMEVAEPRQICPGVETSGELGDWIKEQSLMVRSQQGVILIVGDAHPGIAQVVAEAKRRVADRIHLVLGGFHLGGVSPIEMASVLRSFRELGVEKVAPCHSTADSARELFRQEYHGDYVPIGVGSVIIIS
jgi:7,8-dihydropterin-6-yl-methyl-4-(beta-D-ribofuranosyl)aminobenzene 5'-phosphate synthase